MNLSLKDRQKMLDKINDSQENHKDTEELYLRSTGWRHTCMTPGSFWLWTKDIVYKRYSLREGNVTENYRALCPRSTAVQIQCGLDGQEATE